MAREGTRSATGNSKPRVFQTVDTAPAIRRTNKPKAKRSPTTSTKPTVKKAAAKPTGVTKKKPAASKKEGVATKVGHYIFILSYQFASYRLSLQALLRTQTPCICLLTLPHPLLRKLGNLLALARALRRATLYRVILNDI